MRLRIDRLPGALAESLPIPLSSWVSAAEALGSTQWAATAKVLRLGPNFRQGLGIADPFAIWVYPASAS